MRAVGLDIGTTSISAVVMDALSGKTEKAYTVANDSFLSSDQEAENIEMSPFIEDSYLAVGASLCGDRAYAILADFFRKCAELIILLPSL